MTYESRDVVRDHVVPILLGSGLRTHLLALRIRLCTGIVPYICDCKRHGGTLGYASYFAVCEPTSDELLLHTLSYLVRDTEELGIVIPCTAPFEAFAERNRETLCRMVMLRTPSTVFWRNPLSEC